MVQTEEQKEAEAVLPEGETLLFDKKGKRTRKLRVEANSPLHRFVTPEDEFRRTAALAILSAMVTRHGGFSELEQESIMRLVWQYADVFVAMEHARLPEPEPASVPVKRGRPAQPDDEWAVTDGDQIKRGFVTEEEAQWYASARPGAVVEQVSGDKRIAADINV